MELPVAVLLHSIVDLFTSPRFFLLGCNCNFREIMYNKKEYPGHSRMKSDICVSQYDISFVYKKSVYAYPGTCAAVKLALSSDFCSKASISIRKAYLPSVTGLIIQTSDSGSSFAVRA